MASPELTPDLMETLVALTEGREFNRESIHESIFLQQTVDRFDASASENWPREDSVDAGEEDPEIGSDLRDLPQRQMIEPGGESDPSADYRLVGTIGRGGTGIVFQAHQRAVNREVAIKVLRNHLRKDRAARQRFLAEARTVGALDHPNVIALHELATDATGHPFYSMKRIDGTAWSEVLGERTLDENIDVLMGVADALRYAHSRGIVHRDVKPANVMLGRFGEVLVADWGLALPHPILVPTANKQTSIGGTPAYMAPELASGAVDEVGPQTDVYLLGATLFQVLTGFPPHDGDTLIDCIMNAASNVIRETDLQSELMDVALRAMATRPQDRFTTVHEFQNAVRGYLQHQESIALVRRAARHAGSGDDEPDYEQMSLAISLVREALELWPQNRRAGNMLRRLQRQFAELAFDQGDLDLALSLLEAADEEKTELADEIRRERAERSAQQRREARYTTLFANSPDAVLVSRMQDGTIVEANETFLRLFKLKRLGVIGQRVSEIHLWESPERRLDFVSSLRKTGRIDNFETTLLDSTGLKIPVLISARRAELEGETLIVAHTRDITARRAAENELRHSRSRLRAVQRLANLGTWEYDLQTGEISWSDETFRISGMSPRSNPPSFEEYLDMVHPDDRSALQEALRNSIENGAAYQLQIRHRRPDGTYNSTVGRGQPMVDDAGKIIGLFGSVLDITDRKVIEQSMQHQQHALQSMLDSVGVPVFAIERDGTLIAAAKPVRDLLGATSCCKNQELKLDADPADQLATLEGSAEVRGQFREHERVVSDWLRMRVHAEAQFLRCELLDAAGESAGERLDG